MSISSIARSPLTTTPAVFDRAQNDWLYLIPSIAAIAATALLSSNPTVAVLVGLGTYATGEVFERVAQGLNLLVHEPTSDYATAIENDPLSSTILAPIVEENFFRGFVQPSLTLIILSSFPLAAGAFLGTSFSIAVTVSIVATAVIFGLMHLANDHKNAWFQATFATVGGIALGATAAQFGLIASVAAHMVHNTVTITMAKLS